MQGERGFTLIELLLYVVVATTILLASTTFLATLLESRVKNQTIAEVEQQGLQAMSTMMQTVRNAEAITVPIVGSSTTSLTLDILSAGSDPTVIDVAGGVLRIAEGTGNPVPLTNARVTVSDLVFTNLSRANTPGTVQITFRLSYINSSGRKEYDYEKSFSTSVSLRQP